MKVQYKYNAYLLAHSETSIKQSKYLIKKRQNMLSQWEQYDKEGKLNKLNRND